MPRGGRGVSKGAAGATGKTASKARVGAKAKAKTKAKGVTKGKAPAGYEPSHIPPELWDEVYTTCEELISAVEEGSGRRWRIA
ncbi:hypothetical protein KIPB_000753, partial [Kipferlia bialata]|eukprot:g753.t1